MKWNLTGLTGLTILALELHAPPPVDACGVKLIIKNPSPRKAKARQPIGAEQARPVVAARPNRTPIAAGPTPGDRRVVAVKEPEPKPPTPEPKPEPVATTTTQPKPEPVATTTTQPKPEPAVVEPKPEPKRKPPVVAGKPKQMEIYFGLSSSSVNRRDALDRVAAWLAADTSVNVVIEGHADPTGNAAFNMTLSESRANSVRDYLIGKGIDASRLEVQPFGDTKLKYGRTDGRNRRVAIVPKP